MKHKEKTIPPVLMEIDFVHFEKTQMYISEARCIITLSKLMLSVSEGERASTDL
jgi:hypothetical protein